MSISLVSAPILGFDLVRHPSGPELADTLLTALSLGPHDLLLFTPDSARGSRRQTAWNRVRGIVDSRGAGILTGSVLAGDDEPGPGSAQESPAAGFARLARSLMRSMIVDLDDLERLVRNDVLLWTDSATGPRGTLRAVPRGDNLADTELVRCTGDALIDAIAAQWMDGLDSGTADVLREPFQLVLTQLPNRTVDTGPCSPAVQELLSTLGALGAGDRDRLRTVAELMRATGPEWAAAVHEASWAALTTGRIRSAAAAQLLGVQAFRTAGFTAADGAQGLWNTISGHIQAEVVADVLSVTTYEHLTRTWHAALART